MRCSVTKRVFHVPMRAATRTDCLYVATVLRRAEPEPAFLFLRTATALWARERPIGIYVSLGVIPLAATRK
jgi:hypothetical protein